jgi:hypothetical protein
MKRFSERLLSLYIVTESIDKRFVKTRFRVKLEQYFARQRLVKHLFPRQRMLTKAIPWQQNRTVIEPLDLVIYIRDAWKL